MRYYLWINEKESGPHSEIEIQNAVRDTIISPQTIARREDESEWKAIEELLGSNIKEKSATRQSPTSSIKSEKPTQETPKLSVPFIIEDCFTRTQASIIIVLLVLGLSFPFLSFLKPTPRWEYKTVAFETDGFNSRTGDGALSYNSINLKESVLSSMGEGGWEIATSYLEMETAFPNFGKENYVTGIQPNVRPQRVIVVFKRPKRISILTWIEHLQNPKTKQNAQESSKAPSQERPR